MVKMEYIIIITNDALGRNASNKSERCAVGTTKNGKGNEDNPKRMHIFADYNTATFYYGIQPLGACAASATNVLCILFICSVNEMMRLAIRRWIKAGSSML